MAADSGIQEYINSLLDIKRGGQAPQNPEELAWRIWKIMTDEQRLARRPDAEFRELILGKIKGSIGQKHPITMIDAFGGFKNYRAPSFPHVDWSEVFMLNKLVKQCVKIAVIYEPGVKLEFSGDSEMLTFFNNYPPETIDTYVKEFKQLLDIYQSHIPANVKLSYRGLSDDYDIKELEDRITETTDAMTPEQVEELFKKNASKARNNYMLKGVEDHTQASKEELEKILRRSVALDHVYIDIDLADRHEYLEGGLHLPLIQTAIPGCIALKSVNTSKLAFWLGTGYLRQSGSKWIPYIQHGQRWQELQGVEYSAVESPFSVIPGLDKVPYISGETKPLSDELVGATQAANG